MASLRDVIAYICKNYPHKDKLSNARVTKMVYLADWKSAIERGEQLTGLTWRFDHYGPFVYDVLDTAREDSAFEVIPTQNMYGSQKDLFKVDDDVEYPSLSAEETRILDFVIVGSAPLNWNELIKLIYSTYPIVAQEKFSNLDLIKLAQEYEEVVPLLDSTN